MRIYKIYCITGAFISYLSVIIQFFFALKNYFIISTFQTIINYFSFFTIQTNIIVALAYTFLLLNSKHNLAKFLTSPKTLTAITVYALTSGIIYNIALRHLWHPVGIQKITDEGLHTVAPFMILLFWYLYVPKKDLQWKYSITILIYPLIYAIAILVRGAFTQLYPYPFLDVNKIGYSFQLAINIGALCMTFIALSMMLISVAKFKK